MQVSMNFDWQDIMALTAVAFAAGALAFRAGLFRRGKKRPENLGCWACMKCGKRPKGLPLEEKKYGP